jgi:hypothetical protein
MTSLLFVEKGEEFTKKGVLSAAQNRGRTLGQALHEKLNTCQGHGSNNA